MIISVSMGKESRFGMLGFSNSGVLETSNQFGRATNETTVSSLSGH